MKEIFYSIFTQSLKLKLFKFLIDHKVRINKFKHVFEKGYPPNWTTEVFTVTQIKNAEPTTYLLKDYQNKPISDSVYKQ